MESQMALSHDHEHNRHPQHLGPHQGEEEDHQEKSVLKKVKEKAKKIKNKLTKHGHGHEHEHDHHDLEEEDDVEDEDPEVHGATTIRSSAPEQGDILKVPMVKFGDTKAAATHDHDSKVPHLERTDPMKEYVPAANQHTRQTHSSTMESLVGHDQPKVNFGKTSVMGEAPHAPQNTPLSSFGEHKSNVSDPSQTFLSGKEGHLGQSREHTSVSYLGLGEHRSNATDPSPTFLSGSEGHLGQARVHTPVSSLGGGDYQKTNVGDPRQTSVTGKEGHLGQTRVHLHHRRLDDHTPISSRGDYQKTFATGKEGYFGQSGVNLDRPRGLEEDPHAPKANSQGYTPSNYETKVTDPTHAGGEEIGISILHSFDKMNIHAGDVNPSNQGSSYTEKVSSAKSAIADKAISAKNAVASKLGYGGGNNDQHEFVKPQASSYQTTGQNLSTAENPSNQGSSYTGKISSATHAIADTAISAKNVVASKLGYGGDTDQQQHGDQAAVRSGSAAPEQQGKGITAAVTEKLTPVYEKVAGAGSAVMSKLPGGTGTAGKEEVHRGTATATTTTGGEYNKAGKDKGVSVKDYFSEKLKPGEEDRALSEVISETLHKRKAEQPGSGAPPVGKVTETVEVSRRLGPDYGVDGVQQSSYGKVVADTLKGAVGSLFGKADQSATSPQSLGSSTGTEGFSSSGSGVAERRDHGGVEQRRLNESGK